MRVTSLARAELLLLRRDRTALVNAVLPPLTIVGIAASSSAPARALLVTGLLGMVLIGSVYYTVVTTYVSRREELVLKRLRVGELTDVEILAGTASAAVVLALVQILLYVAAATVLLHLPVPVNPVELVLGALGGAVLFVLLAAASSVFTRTVSVAQFTTLPVVLVSLLGTGMLLPVSALPHPVALAIRFTPLHPVLELMRLGWLGGAGAGGAAGGFGATATDVAVLAGWLVLGMMVVQRWFRWEPRR